MFVLFIRHNKEVDRAKSNVQEVEKIKFTAAYNVPTVRFVHLHAQHGTSRIMRTSDQKR